MTNLQWAILVVVDMQPFPCSVNGAIVDRDYRFTQDERKSALRLEKKKWLKRTDTNGNYFKLMAAGKKALSKENEPFKVRF